MVWTMTCSPWWRNWTLRLEFYDNGHLGNDLHDRGWVFSIAYGVGHCVWYGLGREALGTHTAQEFYELVATANHMR